jgi:hypothetical protein
MDRTKAFALFKKAHYPLSRKEGHVGAEVIFQVEQIQIDAAKDGERNPATLGQRRCWNFKFCREIELHPVLLTPA